MSTKPAEGSTSLSAVSFSPCIRLIVSPIRPLTLRCSQPATMRPKSNTHIPGLTSLKDRGESLSTISIGSACSDTSSPAGPSLAVALCQEESSKSWALPALWQQPRIVSFPSIKRIR